MVLFGQIGPIWEKVILFGQRCCIVAKWFYLGKLVIFGEKWLYSIWAIVVAFGQMWLHLGKVDCIWVNLFYLCKSGSSWSKVVVFA